MAYIESSSKKENEVNDQLDWLAPSLSVRDINQKTDKSNSSFVLNEDVSISKGEINFSPISTPTKKEKDSKLQTECNIDNWDTILEHFEEIKIVEKVVEKKADIIKTVNYEVIQPHRVKDSITGAKPNNKSKGKKQLPKNSNIKSKYIEEDDYYDDTYDDYY